MFRGGGIVPMPPGKVQRHSLFSACSNSSPRDRPGLLHDLTRTLANNNVYIASAVIATYGAQVVDTFYVKDMFGLKFHSKSRQSTLEKRLREAILKGAERAEAG